MPGLIFDPGSEGTDQRFGYVVPKFSGRCVCCSADAGGHVEHYDITAPSGAGHIRGAPVPMPVCQACIPHALDRTSAGYLAGSVLALGVLGIAVGFFMGESEAQGPVMAGGALLAAGGAGWALLQSAREKREKQPGHHPRLYFAVLPGMTSLISDNAALIDELLALNPNARRPGPPASG